MVSAHNRWKTVLLDMAAILVGFTSFSVLAPSVLADEYYFGVVWINWVFIYALIIAIPVLVVVQWKSKEVKKVGWAVLIFFFVLSITR